MTAGYHFLNLGKSIRSEIRMEKQRETKKNDLDYDESITRQVFSMKDQYLKD
jgi:hypothetical protein